VTPKRRRPWVGFTVFAVLAILGLFVLDGAAAGVASLAALLAFIFACMHALRRQDPDTLSHNERTGLSGWFGGWL
jgi:amino acid transporter